MASISTGGCCATTGRCGRRNGDIPGGTTTAPSVCSVGYANRAQAGNYADALRLAAATGTTPDVTATRRVGTLKYGTGISFNQAITQDVGVFTRLGWNDGKTESFAFTAMDRLASGGVSVKRNAVEEKRRHSCDVVYRRRSFRSACGVPGPRRA